jgi:recombinational DNA repair ATPase RecF
MYLKQLHVENNGPLRRLTFELPFRNDGAPLPLILVGGNGSGKTNLLSIVADALFEAAANHYTNVVPGMTPVSHDWFRFVGNITTTHGAPNAFSVLKFTANRLIGSSKKPESSRSLTQRRWWRRT